LAQKSDAKSEEVEMLLTDLENANQRAILAEKEVENLKEQVKFNSENVQGSNFDSGSNETDQLISDLKHELASKDREIDQISTELKQSKEVSQHNLSQNLETIKALEQTNEELSKNLQIQAEKLSNMDDYEIIKKDLSILKTLEFNKDDQDEDQNEEQIPLEVMILERSKTLQIENSALRMDKDKLTTELTSTKESLAEKLNETDKQSILISELEDHVEKLQEHVNRGEAEGRSSTDILLHDLEIKSGRDSPLSVNSSFYGNQNDANSLLPIIQAQRERYKKRNEELEDQQSKQMQQMAILQTEIKDLQADNVKLYEKIRFLQGYQTSSTKKNDSVMIPVETRYKNQYEQKIDPFTTFSNQERQRKYTQLNIVEKIILSMVHFMLSNKIARLFVFAYSVLLHLLVFVVLMTMAYNDSYRREQAISEWQQKYLDHMNEAHQAMDHHAGNG